MSYKPPKPTAIHVKHRTKSEHHIFFKLFIQSYQTPSPASLLRICYRQNVQQTQLHKKKNHYCNKDRVTDRSDFSVMTVIRVRTTLLLSAICRSLSSEFIAYLQHQTEAG